MNAQEIALRNEILDAFTRGEDLNEEEYQLLWNKGYDNLPNHGADIFDAVIMYKSRGVAASEKFYFLQEEDEAALRAGVVEPTYYSGWPPISGSYE